MNASQLSSMICSTCLQASFLKSISTSHPLISLKNSIPKGMWKVVISHHPNSLLLHILPDNSIHQPVCLLQTHNSLKTWFWKQGSTFLFFSEPVDPSLTFTQCLLVHDRDAQVHYPRAAAEWDFILSLLSSLKQFFSLPLSFSNHSLRQMKHPACSISITFT